MGELTIEQKAQRYDGALERARDVYTYYCDDREQLRKIESIFPELKESEDEQIKKEIVSAINIYCSEYHRGTKVRNDMLAWLEKQGEQKSAWSEDDVKCIDELIKFFDSMKDCLAVEERHQENRRWLKFLKSLKGTNIMQQLREWSIEDNIRLQEAIRIVQNYHTNIKDEHLFATSGWCLGWLKSLKDRYTWKPSEEQMENLSRAVNGGTYRTSLLMKLYQDLKKLREE